jgi:hypothetical protein
MTTRKDQQMGLHEIKSFCTTKEIVCKLERPCTEWKKIFASYISDKRLIIRKYRELKKLYFQKIKFNDPMTKMN